MLFGGHHGQTMGESRQGLSEELLGDGKDGKSPSLSLEGDSCQCRNV